MKIESFRRVPGQEYADWWHQRYGTPPDLFAALAFFQRGRATVWVAAASVQLQGLPVVDGVGIPFARIGGRVWKPTSSAAIQFGAAATRNLVEVTLHEAELLVGRSPVLLDRHDPRRQLPIRGYVLARLHGVPIGCVLWRGTHIESCVPKARAVAELDRAPSLDRSSR